MAYNSTTGIVYIDTSSSPNIGVSIGDVQTALSRTENDLGLLCSDKKWESNSLVAADRINPMAKYKPVRHSALGVLTTNQRASTRYGFGSGLPPTLNLSQNSPKNNWTYLPPRGASSSEWFRLQDFNGYAVRACTPLAIAVGQLVYDGESQILLFGDGMSNAVREDGKTWVENQSLSISELTNSNSQATDLFGYYIAFLLIDKTDYEKNLIVTNKTVSNFVNSEFSHYIFKLYAEGDTVSGVTYPAIPILSTSRSGHTFEIITCLMAGNNPSTGGYAVYTSSTSPSVVSLIPYSLGFVDTCDRIEEELDSGAFKMDGTEVTSAGWNVIVTDTAMEGTDAGQVYRAYSLEIRATFSTQNAAAYTGSMTISGLMSFATSGRFGPTLEDSGSLPAQGVAVSLSSKTANQNKLLWSSGGVNYMWIPKVNGSVVSTQLDLSVDFDYPFSAGHHATGTYTVNIPN